MARLCGSKSQKLGLNVNPSAKCTFQIEFPPLLDPDNMYTRMKAERNFGPNQLNCTESPISTSKLRFQCHFEERKRRAECRRKKIIQKLKKNYAIDVEGLNEDVTREIILKAEMLEKEKRQREKRNVERMMTMITRLLEEQKYKNRGSKMYLPSSKKPFKTIPGPKFIEQVSEKQSESTGYLREISSGSFGKGEGVTGESKTGPLGDRKLSKNSFEPKPSKISAQEEEIKELPKCVDVKQDEEALQVVPYTKLIQKPRPSCLPIERCLTSTPKCVVFNNYEKGKVYLQDLRITNIGVETIHCRYLGIVVHTKGEDRFPVGVAVRDNVKLRPGLCCSTKIRLCSQEDTKELRCSVVYETRRQKKPLQHSWFFVPVVCVPLRATVEAFPLKIIFPSLTWCEATGPEGTKLLSKFLKIENSGGKACSCRISKVTLRADKNEGSAEDEEEGEGTEGDKESIKTKSRKPEGRNSPYNNFNHLEEFGEEDYLVPCDNAEDTAKSLVDELFDNIFAPFRFSIRYFIYIPPFSTVQIEVRFLPNYKGFHHEVCFLQFEDSDNCDELPVELVGDIKQIPLRLEPQVIDLKTCIANSGVYAATFTLFNESKGPYSVALKIPSSMKKHAHVYPRATTLLPLHSSDFSVRIYPRVTLARDAPRYYNENSQVLEFPVFIYPANFGVCKRDSLKIYVFALITDYCLELSPSFINFGTVTTLETVRAEMELTNYSLAVQEYGFLNLPKGVRVEPNMGFGRILPKETITLYLLYSPGEDLMGYDNAQEVHEFQIAVTSIAKHGGFKEKLESDEESPKHSDLIWEEDHDYEFSAVNVKSYSDDQLQPEDSEDFDVCEEESSIEGEEFCSKLYQQENMIREYLQGGGHKISEHSFFKRMRAQAQDSLYPKDSETENRRENVSEYGEFEGYSELKGICAPKADLHIVNCRARIVQPHCRISETVIQLPATSCSSFSLYRFRLDCFKVQGDINCSCGFRRTAKCGKKSFPSRFEFQYFCPNIKLEPESGFIKPGDSLPITIIHRPEFPAEQLQNESRLTKAQKSVSEVKSETQSTPNPKRSMGKQNTPNSKILESTSKNSIEDVINVTSFELDNSDFFAGEKNLSKLISPFHLVTKLQCVIKTASCDDRSEKTEIHEMVLICPAIKPNFIFLGNSQEIKFNKVFVGTRSKMVLQLENISLERASPSATLLNPVGPFYCPAGVKKVEVDPEHIWRQPLVYAPLEEKGIEKQFFEIYCESTNIFLTVSGEAILPEYKIIPNFTCCQIEAKPGTSEELKLEMENLSHITMRIYVKTDFSKEGPDAEIPLEKEENMEEETKTKKAPKEDVKGDKKKFKNLGNENFQFWDAVPEIINSMLESFEDISQEDPKAFSFLGVNDNNEILIPPSGKQQIKIQFKPPGDKNYKKHAIKYVLMLEGITSLKEVLIIGKISRGK